MSLSKYQKRVDKQEVMFVSSLKDKLSDIVENSQKAFSEPNILVNAIIKAAKMTLINIESLLGEKIFIRQYGDEFDHIDAKLKKLIVFLVENDIVSSFKFLLPPSDWPNIICVEGKLHPITLQSGKERHFGGANGIGTDFNYNDAAYKAVAELIERYSLAVYDTNKFISGSYNQLREQNAINPKLFFGFSEHQMLNDECKNKHMFDNDTKFKWMLAQSLYSAKEYLVPAQLVYMTYDYSHEEEPIIRQTTTNGAAAGSSWAMAAYRAICETIERDAFMIFWLNKISPPKFDLNTFMNPQLQHLLGQCKKLKIDLHLLDITTDIEIPTILAIIVDPLATGRMVNVTACTDINLEEAALHATIECLRMGIMRKPTMKEKKQTNLSSEIPRTINERRTYWKDNSLMPNLLFLLKGPLKTFQKNNHYTNSYDQKLKILRKKLKEQSIDVYLADVSTYFAKKGGLIILMSLIPNLYPLYLDEEYRYLGIERLYEVPRKMGYSQKEMTEDDFNLTPHPFL